MYGAPPYGWNHVFYFRGCAIWIWWFINWFISWWPDLDSNRSRSINPRNDDRWLDLVSHCFTRPTGIAMKCSTRPTRVFSRDWDDWVLSCFVPCHVSMIFCDANFCMEPNKGSHRLHLSSSQKWSDYQLRPCLRGSTSIFRQRYRNTPK